jgi:hypothetical protein
MNRYTIGILVGIILLVLASSMDPLLFSQIAVGLILLALLSFIAWRKIRKRMARGRMANQDISDLEKVRR